MTLLNKKAILAAMDLKTEDVAVPEWGGDVRVRTLTGTERDAFESGLVQKDGKRDLSNLRARLVSLAIIDENGARPFSETDAALLGGKSAAALPPVSGARLCPPGAVACEPRQSPACRVVHVPKS